MPWVTCEPALIQPPAVAGFLMALVEESMAARTPRARARKDKERRARKARAKVSSMARAKVEDKTATHVVFADNKVTGAMNVLIVNELRQ